MSVRSSRLVRVHAQLGLRQRPASNERRTSERSSTARTSLCAPSSGSMPRRPTSTLGFRPSASQRMRAFQDAGHIGVLIVGDYTTRIGDPVRTLGGASRHRPGRGPDRNAQRYSEHAFTHPRPRPHRAPLQQRVAGEARLRGAPPADAHRALSPACSSGTTFANASRPTSRSRSPSCCTRSCRRYDSVAIEADVELGGTDQLYNLLMGRDVMEAYGLEPQVVLTSSCSTAGTARGDERVARQLHRIRGAAGRAVREGDAIPDAL